MLMSDFFTLVQHDLPVKVVVFNNGSFGFIEIEQKSSGFLDAGTTLKNPNFWGALLQDIELMPQNKDFGF